MSATIGLSYQYPDYERWYITVTEYGRNRHYFQGYAKLEVDLPFLEIVLSGYTTEALVNLFHSVIAMKEKKVTVAYTDWDMSNEAIKEGTNGLDSQAA